MNKINCNINNLVVNNEPLLSDMGNNGFFVGSDGLAGKLGDNIGHLPYYLEYIAKGLHGNAKDVYDCKPMYVYSTCKSHSGESHHVVKTVRCGKEWCKTCGSDKSSAHLRRVSRWWNKVMSLNTIGYLVVTMPLEVRDFFKDKEALAMFRRFLVMKMKRIGIKRGLGRWHWAGEDGKVWHPHLNFLFEHRYFSKKELNTWRDSIAKWFTEFTGVVVKKVNLKYKYSNKTGWKIHKLFYVNRATMLNYPGNEIAFMLKGFRTTMSWGDWKEVIEKVEVKSDEEIMEELESEENKMRSESEYVTADEVKEVMAIKKINKNRCPCCNGELKWHGVVGAYPSKDLGFEEISEGIFVRVVKDGDNSMPYGEQIIEKKNAPWRNEVIRKHRRACL